jgi:ribonuclease D
MKLKEIFEELGKAKVIGLDSEWTTYTCLFQLSTSSKTYLIDMLKPIHPNEFNEKILTVMIEHFLCDIFTNPNIIKVSWDFIHDVEKLVERFSQVGRSRFCQVKSLIDFLDYKDPLLPNGFSAFCKHHLGKELDKGNQCSKWADRPLSESQVIYAAIDSIAAVRLYEKISLEMDLTPKTYKYEERIKARRGKNYENKVRAMIYNK